MPPLDYPAFLRIIACTARATAFPAPGRTPAHHAGRWRRCDLQTPRAQSTTNFLKRHSGNGVFLCLERQISGQASLSSATWLIFRWRGANLVHRLSSWVGCTGRLSVREAAVTVLAASMRPSCCRWYRGRRRPPPAAFFSGPHAFPRLWPPKQQRRVAEPGSER